MEATPSIRQQGMQALQEGNLDKATDLLSRAVMLDDKDNDAKALLGIAYSQKGLHAQAKRALETAVQMEPQNANYRFNLGVVLARAGEMPAAAAAYRDTLLVNPQHAQARAKMQEFGAQVHQLLAAAPRLNVPPPEGAAPPSAPPQQAAPMPMGAPMGAPIGAPPIGGAPMGAPPVQQTAYAPPPPPMSTSGDGSGGPAGTVQCQYCFKHSKMGMVCEHCSQPLPPPPKTVAPPPTPMGYGGPTGAPVPGYAAHAGGLPDSGMDTGEAVMRRFAAQLIDGLLTTVVSIGVLLAVVPSLRSGQPPTEAQINAMTGQIYGIFYGIRFGYFAILTGIRGQTLGKMALGIRVVNTDSEPPGIGRALLRETIGRILSSLFCGLGTFWMLWDSKQQTWHDKISGTIVERT